MGLPWFAFRWEFLLVALQSIRFYKVRRLFFFPFWSTSKGIQLYCWTVSCTGGTPSTPVSITLPPPGIGMKRGGKRKSLETALNLSENVYFLLKTRYRLCWNAWISVPHKLVISSSILFSFFFFFLLVPSHQRLCFYSVF